MKKSSCLILTLLMLVVSALADEAQDITGACTFVRKTNQVDFSPVMDNNHASFFKMNPKRVVEIHAEEDISGVYLQFFRFSAALEVYVLSGSDWISAGRLDG